MPRRRLPPRLCLDKKRGQWFIRDGQSFIRTSCAKGELGRAEQVLGAYIAEKYRPQPSSAPPVADVLLAYLRDKVPGMKSRSTKYNISNLAQWWSDKTLAEVTAANCRAYATTRTPSQPAQTWTVCLPPSITGIWNMVRLPLSRLSGSRLKLSPGTAG